MKNTEVQVVGQTPERSADQRSVCKRTSIRDVEMIPIALRGVQTAAVHSASKGAGRDRLSFVIGRFIARYPASSKQHAHLRENLLPLKLSLPL